MTDDEFALRIEANELLARTLNELQARLIQANARADAAQAAAYRANTVIYACQEWRWELPMMVLGALEVWEKGEA